MHFHFALWGCFCDFSDFFRIFLGFWGTLEIFLADFGPFLAIFGHFGVVFGSFLAPIFFAFWGPKIPKTPRYRRVAELHLFIEMALPPPPVLHTLRGRYRSLSLAPLPSHVARFSASLFKSLWAFYGTIPSLMGSMKEHKKYRAWGLQSTNGVEVESVTPVEGGRKSCGVHPPEAKLPKPEGLEQREAVHQEHKPPPSPPTYR